MRKLISVIAFTAVSAVFSFAQQTQSNHSLTVNLAGLNYNYEQSLGKQFSAVASAGAAMEFGLTSWSGFVYNIHPSVSIEPRWYYNLNRRYNKGNKRTYLNSGGFLSVDTRYIFKPVIVDGTVKESYTLISPTWGFRRVYGEHFLMEINTGWHFIKNNHEKWCGKPRLNFKLGYVF